MDRKYSNSKFKRSCVVAKCLTEAFMSMQIKFHDISQLVVRDLYQLP